ncbi:MAG: VCBS repeat-containing protein [Bryobacteraceae bacterium]
MRAFPLIVPAWALLLLASCGNDIQTRSEEPQTVAATPTRARTPGGMYISWKEHLIDDQQLSGGIPLRGTDGLQMADFDKDGYMDVVSVHEDSSHVRIAFGTADPDRWELVTLAEGDEAGAAEDAAVGDLNGDGFPDIIVACELAHLIYFQNPGKSARTERWARTIPENTKNRGSFIRVFFADLNKDGRLEVVAANKGEQSPTVVPGDELKQKHPNKEISWFQPPANPLNVKAWKETVLTRIEVPINAQPVDLDGDGDLDILAGSRWDARSFWFENLGGKRIRFREHRVEVIDRNVPWQRGAKRLTAFMVDFFDLSGDGRLDIVMNESPTLLIWLEQPARFEDPWQIHKIGSIAPDSPTGIAIADIDGDSRPDVMTGGYSQNPRDHDGENIDAESVAGRLAWFQNSGDPKGTWVRHDISRTKRGMYDAFLARDMDGDGDLDFIATRGNTGNFDGVFWLEQVRTSVPAISFQPAREVESAHLPLPAGER